jgi:hypothetical protein
MDIRMLAGAGFVGPQDRVQCEKCKIKLYAFKYGDCAYGAGL